MTQLSISDSWEPQTSKMPSRVFARDGSDQDAEIEKRSDQNEKKIEAPPEEGKGGWSRVLGAFMFASFGFLNA